MDDIIKGAVSTALEYIQTGKEPEGWVPPRRRCSEELRGLVKATLDGCNIGDNGTTKLYSLLEEILGDGDNYLRSTAPIIAEALIQADNAMGRVRANARAKSVLAWAAHTVLKAVFAFAKEERAAMEEWAALYHEEAVKLASFMRSSQRGSQYFEIGCRTVAPYIPWLISLQRRGIGGNKGQGVLGTTCPKNANFFPDWPMPTPISPSWRAWDAAMEQAGGLVGSALLTLPACNERVDDVHTDDVCTMVGVALFRVIDGLTYSPGLGRVSLAMYRLWLTGDIPRETYRRAHYFPACIYFEKNLRWFVDCLDAAIDKEYILPEGD